MYLTANVKYVFIDIVEYTNNRSVEAQTDIVYSLNKIVLDVTEKLVPPTDDPIVFIPTGDGICIALIDSPNPYDLHIKIAVEILQGVQEYNGTAANEMRKFKLRVGVNENIDNLITDINKDKNLAGSGINNAQRIMSLADPNQIIVGSAVYEQLKQREKYMHCFREINATIKHDSQITAYQFIDKSLPFIDISVPSCIKEKEEEQVPLSSLAAFFLAHCLQSESYSLLKVKVPYGGFGLTILYFYLAKDSYEDSIATPTKPRNSKFVTLPKDDWYTKHITGLNKFFIVDMARAIFATNFKAYERYIKGHNEPFVTEEGKQALKLERLDIYQLFGLSY